MLAAALSVKWRRLRSSPGAATVDSGPKLASHPLSTLVSTECHGLVNVSGKLGPSASVGKRLCEVGVTAPHANLHAAAWIRF